MITQFGTPIGQFKNRVIFFGTQFECIVRFHRRPVYKYRSYSGFKMIFSEFFSRVCFRQIFIVLHGFRRSQYITEINTFQLWKFVYRVKYGFFVFAIVSCLTLIGSNHMHRVTRMSSGAKVYTAEHPVSLLIMYLIWKVLDNCTWNVNSGGSYYRTFLSRSLFLLFARKPYVAGQRYRWFEFRSITRNAILWIHKKKNDLLKKRIELSSKTVSIESRYSIV